MDKRTYLVLIKVVLDVPRYGILGSWVTTFYASWLLVHLPKLICK